MRDDSLVIPCPSPVKAGLHPVTGTLSPLVNEAIRTSHGKQDAAARAVGKDPGNFNRDLKRWSATVEELGPDFLVALGQQLLDSFGPEAESPAARVRRKAKELRAVAEELEALANYMSEVS